MYTLQDSVIYTESDFIFNTLLCKIRKNTYKNAMISCFALNHQFYIIYNTASKVRIQEPNA
jgi:hypothetical protein